MTPSGEPQLTIGQVAERAGVNTSHSRFYERVGVLPEPDRVAGQRRYRDEVVHRLSIIDVAQRAGLTLEEIAPLTGPSNRGADAGRHIRRIADEKLPHPATGNSMQHSAINAAPAPSNRSPALTRTAPR
jgi:DNA-binding transcriptional MerR regulator